MAVDRRNRNIFIVDDDPIARDLLSEMFTQAGYRVTCFADGTSFITAARRRVPACVILDIFMPGRTGLEVLRDLDATKYPAPIFITSGCGDIPSAVDAIKNGAFDFFEKKSGERTLVENVRDAMDAWKLRQRDGNDLRPSSFPGSELLTRREGEVLAQIAASATNKEAARNLGISKRTVEIHRTHIMHKLAAKNSVDLMRKVLGSERHA